MECSVRASLVIQFGSSVGASLVIEPTHVGTRGDVVVSIWRDALGSAFWIRVVEHVGCRATRLRGAKWNVLLTRRGAQRLLLRRILGKVDVSWVTRHRSKRVWSDALGNVMRSVVRHTCAMSA